MNRIYDQFLRGGLLCASLLLSLSSCTDDHFEVQPGAPSGANTIWKNISSNPELTSLAEILQRTPVMRTESDRGRKQSYADFLNTSQEMTMWAPKNGTYNAQAYLDSLDKADALKDTDLQASMKLYYMVSNQFVRNHLALFNYASSQSSQQVRLLNGKLASYSASDSLFNGVRLADGNITDVVSSNGMLHVLDGVSPFAYNIYDYLSVNPSLSRMNALVTSYDKFTFSENASTEGSMNDKGQMEYIDSVYIYSNELLSTSSAFHIATEDSLFVAIVPSDEAYAGALDTISPLYRYADSYEYEWSESKGADGGFLYTKTNVNPNDSLTHLNTYRSLLGTMLISPSLFPGVDKSDSASVINHVLYADSLVTTSGVILYNKANRVPGDRNINPVFEGVTPVKASNGYVFVVDEYKVDPAYSFIRRNALDFHSYNIVRMKGVANGAQTMYLTSETRTDTLLESWGKEPVTGDVEDDTYTYYEFVKGSGNFELHIRLNNVLSGKYRISVITVPNRINLSTIQVDGDGNEVLESPNFTAELLGDDLKLMKGTKKTSSQDIDQTRVNKHVLWESVEIPESYSGLDFSTFPMLHITISNRGKGKAQGVGFSKVILEPVRE
ncbi:hypothetical protein [Muribaculum intestinale]|uniref:hypothetical protein n=1 Tax=Muribaculum intestinale TaxID=1796646 RepID=UPI002676040E|nr:hypothetical protein [Muribaculum intestinale]